MKLDLKPFEEKMKKSISVLEDEFGGIRVGKASARTAILFFIFSSKGLRSSFMFVSSVYMFFNFQELYPRFHP